MREILGSETVEHPYCNYVGEANITCFHNALALNHLRNMDLSSRFALPLLYWVTSETNDDRQPPLPSNARPQPPGAFAHPGALILNSSWIHLSNRTWPSCYNRACTKTLLFSSMRKQA